LTRWNLAWLVVGGIGSAGVTWEPRLCQRTFVGLAGTISNTYEEPYNLARRFASLDHVSRGRAAWNMVTTVDSTVAGNFGNTQHPPREERYARATEFVQVAQALWDSWDDDLRSPTKRLGPSANLARLVQSIIAENIFTSMGR
jgi:alkanesulfonate monooxygenase SsuD/methylene tetrahydromethanopterin reductase-like flavin-dependent oxidoreductase (luciferase family)